MIRNYKNYNIQQRKDGRYTVTITDHGHQAVSIQYNERFPQHGEPILPRQIPIHFSCAQAAHSIP